MSSEGRDLFSALPEAEPQVTYEHTNAHAAHLGDRLKCDTVFPPRNPEIMHALEMRRASHEQSIPILTTPRRASPPPSQIHPKLPSHRLRLVPLTRPQHLLQPNYIRTQTLQHLYSPPQVPPKIQPNPLLNVPSHNAHTDSTPTPLPTFPSPTAVCDHQAHGRSLSSPPQQPATGKTGERAVLFPRTADHVVREIVIRHRGFGVGRHHDR